MKQLTPLLVSFFCLCGSSQLPAQQAHEALINKFGAAFNAHDAEKMAEMVATDFQLFYVSKQGKAELSTSGPDALRAEMKQYFQSLPTVKSTMDQRNEVGSYVSFRETARWTDASGKQRSQASLAVYQIAKGKIQRVWYYPAQ